MFNQRDRVDCLGKASAVETLKENGNTLKENLKNGKEKGALSIVHRVFNN